MAFSRLSRLSCFLVVVFLFTVAWSSNCAGKNPPSDGSLFLALNLDAKAFPSRNSGPVRHSRVDETPPYLKCRAGIFVIRTSLTAITLIALANDVNVNPGPANSSSSANFSWNCDSSCSSCNEDSEEFNRSRVCSDSDDDYCDPYPFFDLGLGDKGLRIGHWNINRLTTTKFDQMKLLLVGKNGRPQIDIFFLNETFLKPDSPDSLYTVPGFSIHRRDRKGKQRGGGVMAFVNDELYSKRRTDLEETDLEVVWLEVCPFKSKRSVFIAGIYRPPSYSKEQDIHLVDNIETAYLLNKETILLGDFNVDFLNKQTFKKHQLIRGLTSMNFKQLVNQITRPVSGTCLDHIFSNCPERIPSATIHDIGLSDHLPIFGVRYYRRNEESRPHGKVKTITYRAMNHFDEQEFKSSLAGIPWDTAFIFDEVDDMLDAWESLFANALDTHCPWRQKRVARVNQAPWMTKGIIRELRKRDTFLKVARRTNMVVDWDNYKAARNKAVNLIKSAKHKFYSGCFDNNKNNARKMWKTIKSLVGGNNKNLNANTLRDENLTNRDATDAAEKFNSHFSSVAERLRTFLPHVLFDISKLKNFVQSRKDSTITFSIPAITESIVVDSLKKISSHKAMGADKISVRMLKIAAPIIAPSVAKLMNASFESAVFPQRWKTAKVTPLFKSGDRSDVNNYRPISVLPALSKIMERHVHDNLYRYLCDNDLLYSQQSGFRKYHSTETALIRIIDQLLFSLDNNRVSGLVLIDYRKAFDMVDHETLLTKLQTYGINESSILWFQSYLSERRQFVSLDGKASTQMHVPHGVPQGSILGPLMFIVFINDLPLHVQSADVDVDLYADDTTLTSSADAGSVVQLRNSLNGSLNNVIDWANANKLPLNETKTKSILITGKRLLNKIKLEDRQLNLSTANGNILEQVQSARVLGLEMDSELSFDNHVDKLCSKLSQRIGILNKIKGCLPLKQRILYYNAMIKPIMNYVNVVWHNCSKNNLLRILRLQKRAARIILDAEPRSSSVKLFMKLRWIPFYEEAQIAKCALAFKRVKQTVPSYLMKTLRMNNETHSRSTRYSNFNFICPIFKRKTEGGRTFTVTTCQLWNSLSLNIRKQPTVKSFRNLLRNQSLVNQQFLAHFNP